MYFISFYFVKIHIFHTDKRSAPRNVYKHLGWWIWDMQYASADGIRSCRLAFASIHSLESVKMMCSLEAHSNSNMFIRIHNFHLILFNSCIHFIGD